MNFFQNYFPTILRRNSGSGDRNKLLWVAGLFFLFLLTLLSVLQYRWIGQLNETERDRMNRNLKISLERFSDDFDREFGRIFSAFDAFRNDAERGENLTAEWTLYKVTAPFPGLIQDIYLSEMTPGREPGLFRLDTLERDLKAEEWPGSFSSLKEKSRIESKGDRQQIYSLYQGLFFQDSLVFLVIPDAGAFEKLGQTGKRTPVTTLLVRLNQAYMKTVWIPALAGDYFSTDGSRDYDFTILDTVSGKQFYSTHPIQTPDFSWPVANVRARDLIVLAGTTEPAKRIERVKEKLNHLAKIKTFSFSFSSGETTRVQINRVPAVKIKGKSRAVNPDSKDYPVTVGVVTHPDGLPVIPDSIPVKIAAPHAPVWVSTGAGPSSGGSFSVSVPDFPETPEVPAEAPEILTENFFGPETDLQPESGWVIQAAHVAGSLDAAVKTIRMKNLLISTGILLLLAGSMGFLLVSSIRAWNQSRQQIEFVAGITHELRTPLAVIRSAAENLADGVVTGKESQVKYGKLIRDEGKRLSDMIEQVLNFSGIQSGRKNWVFTRLDAGEALTEQLPSLQEMADARSIRLEVQTEENLLIYADKKAFQTIVRNLIENAVKYSPDHSVVILRLAEEGASVVLTVRDFGLGIPDEEKNRIFEPFFRGKAVTEAQIHGNGLGLSLVQSLVTVLKGEISVKSEPGKGSEFRISVPSEKKKGAN